MFISYKDLLSITDRMSNIFRRILLILMVSFKVTVLLFIIIPGAVRAYGSSQTDVRLFEFSSEFYMPMGNGRIEGFMVSDGLRQRIAICWIEPAVYNDSSYFLGYSDFIFEEDVVHYWIQGMSKLRTFNLSDGDNIPFLPRDVSPESVARSALAIVNRVRTESSQEDISLEMGRFFKQSRDKSDYSYEVSSKQIISDESSISSVSDEQILNELPYGRKYSKETQNDGTIVWRVQRVLDGPHVARVTVKPVSSTEHNSDERMFDPNSLGYWTLVPEPYRAYWSFDREYSELKNGMDNTVASRELYDRIEAYLDKNETPERTEMNFNKLLFKTAMLTGDIGRVSRSAHNVVAALCRGSSVNSYQCLLELARIDSQIREIYPVQADEIVCPLVALMIKHIGRDTPGNIERLMPTMENNKWFSYGKMLIEEARIQALIEKGMADTFADRLQASRLARELPPFDPCQKCDNVKQYLERIDDNPPKGNLTIDDVREILQKGFENPFTDANLNSRDEIIENTIHSIRLIVGDGPFHGNNDLLIKSIQRFSGLYLVVFRYQEPIDTVLATFLALSFCDISTDEDHEILFSQIQKICAEFQVLTNKMLDDRELVELATPDVVERLFNRYKQRFRNYIDDPLWPPFKFPLTDNEQTRLRNKLKLQFSRLEPFFEDMALKVKYGGISDELKQRTCYEIAKAILQLLPQAAFLRRPPYPGVSCRHRGGYGFASVIRGPLYVEDERPREKFKVMKYFHLGHRLEEIVKREREVAINR